MKELFIALLFSVVMSNATAGTILSGTPSMRSTVGPEETIAIKLGKDQAQEYAMQISEEDGEYYWSSRENTPLVKTVSGAFTTYIAVNGSGYIRIRSKDLTDVVLGEDSPEYSEHLTMWLSSVTYYGNLH